MNIEYPIKVSKRLEMDYVQMYLRSRAYNKKRRDTFRRHFRMWQTDNDPGQEWARARYVFILQQDYTRDQTELNAEMAQHGDIYVVNNLPSYNATEELVEHSIILKI